MLIDFVGNRGSLMELEKNLEGELSHSYLFLGSEGLGKFTAAKAFARRILCKDTDVECKFVDDFSHPDLKIVRSEDSIKKNQIEELISESAMMPYSSKNKVFIVDGFGDATVQAQNALLKILEEPQDYVKIILCANEVENILPTIISRSRVIKFKDVTEKEIKAFLINKESISNKNAELFSKIAAGSVKRALRYSGDPSFFALRDKTIEVFDRIINVNVLPIREMDFFAENKSEIQEILSIFLIFLRDIIMYKNNLESKIINIDKEEFIKKQKISSKNALTLSNEILKTNKRLKSNANFELTMETLLINVGGTKW